MLRYLGIWIVAVVGNLRLCSTFHWLFSNRLSRWRGEISDWTDHRFWHKCWRGGSLWGAVQCCLLSFLGQHGQRAIIWPRLHEQGGWGSRSESCWSEACMWPGALSNLGVLLPAVLLCGARGKSVTPSASWQVRDLDPPPLLSWGFATSPSYCGCTEVEFWFFQFQCNPFASFYYFLALEQIISS